LSDDFQRMVEEAQISENLVCSFLSHKFKLQFHLVSSLEQKINADIGLHIPDLLCVEKPRVAFEVKEDKLSGKTGNLCFEADCLARLRAWGYRANVHSIYLLYINHVDYFLDVFELGMGGARLEVELISYVERYNDCKIINSNNKDLFIIPLSRARLLHSCITYRFFNELDMFLFSKAAMAKLVTKE